MGAHEFTALGHTSLPCLPQPVCTACYAHHLLPSLPHMNVPGGLKSVFGVASLSTLGVTT